MSSSVICPRPWLVALLALVAAGACTPRRSGTGSSSAPPAASSAGTRPADPSPETIRLAPDQSFECAIVDGDAVIAATRRPARLLRLPVSGASPTVLAKIPRDVGRLTRSGDLYVLALTDSSSVVTPDEVVAIERSGEGGLLPVLAQVPGRKVHRIGAASSSVVAMVDDGHRADIVRVDRRGKIDVLYAGVQSAVGGFAADEAGIFWFARAPGAERHDLWTFDFNEKRARILAPGVQAGELALSGSFVFANDQTGPLDRYYPQSIVAVDRRAGTRKELLEAELVVRTLLTQGERLCATDMTHGTVSIRNRDGSIHSVMTGLVNPQCVGVDADAIYVLAGEGGIVRILAR
jgi:hypothetical protein